MHPLGQHATVARSNGDALGAENLTAGVRPPTSLVPLWGDQGHDVEPPRPSVVLGTFHETVSPLPSSCATATCSSSRVPGRRTCQTTCGCFGTRVWWRPSRQAASPTTCLLYTS